MKTDECMNVIYSTNDLQQPVKQGEELLEVSSGWAETSQTYSAVLRY